MQCDYYGMKELGKIIATGRLKTKRHLRKSKGFSLEELAQMTGGECTASDLDRFEKGDWSISAVGFIFMCKALEIKDPDDILYRET